MSNRDSVLSVVLANTTLVNCSRAGSTLCDREAVFSIDTSTLKMSSTTVTSTG